MCRLQPSRHGRQQDVVRIQTVDPVDDVRLRSWAHRLRDDVGIQDDHSSRTAARGGSVQPGRSSSTPPVPEKRCRIRVALPGPPTWRSKAVRKISRTSGSIDRPCSAALTRSAAVSSSSNLRIVKVAISRRVTRQPPHDCPAVQSGRSSRLHCRHPASCGLRGQCPIEGRKACLVSYRDVENATVGQLQPTAGVQFGKA